MAYYSQLSSAEASKLYWAFVWAKALSMMGVNPNVETVVHGNFGNCWNQLRHLYMDDCGGLVSALDYGASKRLFYLHLLGSSITKLPDSIGLMKSLEYLVISCERLQCLLKSMGTLERLEFLHLKDCRNLIRLSKTLGALRNLKFLSFERCGIKNLPRSLGQLSQLLSL